MNFASLHTTPKTSLFFLTFLPGKRCDARNSATVRYAQKPFKTVSLSPSDLNTWLKPGENEKTAKTKSLTPAASFAMNLLSFLMTTVSAPGCWWLSWFLFAVGVVGLDSRRKGVVE